MIVLSGHMVLHCYTALVYIIYILQFAEVPWTQEIISYILCVSFCVRRY